MKKNHFFIFLCLVIVLLLTFTACDSGFQPGNNNSSGEISISFDGQTWECSLASAITTLAEDDSDSKIFVIGIPGTYRLTGTLTDAQLRVNVSKTEKVDLIFDNFNATNSTSSPVYIQSADKVKIILADGTKNTLKDSTAYTFPENETKPNACLYSSEDLTIEGEGSLVIQGKYNNGIGCKNDLKIKSGNYQISAVKNAIKGNDSVTIEGGMIEILRCKDGIKTDSEEDYKGILSITGGIVNITASDDGLQASQEIIINGCKVIITAEGKAVNCQGTVSADEKCLTIK